VMTSKSLVGMGVCLRAQGRVRTPEMTGDTGQSPTLDAHANTEEQVSKCACGDSEAAERCCLARARCISTFLKTYGLRHGPMYNTVVVNAHVIRRGGPVSHDNI